MELWLEWDTCWQELIPKKEESYSCKKKKCLQWFSLASDLEKYLKKCQSNSVVIWQENVHLNENGLHPGGPQQAVIYSLHCTCMGAGYFSRSRVMPLKAGFPRHPGNWFCRFLGALTSFLHRTHSRLCASLKHKQQVRFYLLNCFQNHWILLFQVAGLYFAKSKNYLDNYGCVQKCSHPQNDLTLFSLWFFLWKYGYFLKA